MIFGIVLFIAGILIRIYGYRSLKNPSYWRIFPSRLITDGAYKFARHPMYTGTIIMFTGFCVAFIDSFATGLFLMLLLVSFLLDRIDREEQSMILTWGKEYLDYMNKTKMFVPFLF